MVNRKEFARNDTMKDIYTKRCVCSRAEDSRRFAVKQNKPEHTSENQLAYSGLICILKSAHLSKRNYWNILCEANL
ncbi:MAG: hypothetical protein IJD91_01755 [Clostridia bacterium]|nr:hypothetical protein [Clostridia bacterium]